MTATPLLAYEVVLVVAYLLALATLPRLLLRRHESTATLSWLFFIFLLPLAGVPAYWLFGSSRLRRVRRRRARAEGQIAGGRAEVAAARLAVHRPDRGGVPGDLEPALRLADRLGDGFATVGNRVELLCDGEATYAALETAIAGAASHVHLEYYEFLPDRTGARFRDLLAGRARQGVEVRLLYDHAGSFSLGPRFLEPLRLAGGRAAAFLPVNPLRRRTNPTLRNHRKIAVVDGRLGFTGGINIGDGHLSGGDRRRRWRDTHARVVGPAVHWLQETFAEDWFFAADEDLHQARYFPEQELAGEQLVQVLASGPDRPWEVFQRALVTAIGLARQSVLVTTPYLVPDQALQMALENAALRGVEVTLLLPRRSDHRLLDHTARSFFPELLAAGVRIFEFGPGMMHAKTAVVDGVWSTVGSANMDVRSFRLNFEANLVVHDRTLAGELTRLIERDLSEAVEVRAVDLRRRPLRLRLLDGAARILAPVL